MVHFVRSITLPVSSEEAFRYHQAPGTLRRLIPPWQNISIESTDDRLIDGAIKKIQIRQFGMTFQWNAVHEDCDPPHRFADRQLTGGPFQHWKHTHLFQSIGPKQSILTDSIEFEPPMGWLGRTLLQPWIFRELDRLFRYRHQITHGDLFFASRLPLQTPKRIAVTGSHGMVGSRVCSLLISLGHQVVRIVRSTGTKSKGSEKTSVHDRDIVYWSPNEGLQSLDGLEGLDGIIHLAGKNIAANRWSKRTKMELRSSRVDATLRIVEQLRSLSSPPEVLVAASAVGYYGDRGDRALVESDPAGEGFLPKLAQDWESASRSFEEIGRRTCLARLAMVLGAREGALSKLLPLYRMGLGGVLGGGAQAWSWIDVDDAATALVWMALEPSASGIYNVSAPRTPTNQEFSGALAKLLRRPDFLPVPRWALRGTVGQMADELLLCSCRAVPKRLLDAGFSFRFPDLESCLRHQLGIAERV